MIIPAHLCYIALADILHRVINRHVTEEDND